MALYRHPSDEHDIMRHEFELVLFNNKYGLSKDGLKNLLCHPLG